jgi:hypothetical protein
MTISRISFSLKLTAISWLPLGVWLATSYVRDGLERAQPHYFLVAGGYMLFALARAVQAIMSAPENDKALTPAQRATYRFPPFVPLLFNLIVFTLK